MFTQMKGDCVDDSTCLKRQIYEANSQRH